MHCWPRLKALPSLGPCLPRMNQAPSALEPQFCAYVIIRIRYLLLLLETEHTFAIGAPVLLLCACTWLVVHASQQHGA